MRRAAGKTQSEWTPSLWRETFDELLSDELDSDDPWSLVFNYSQSDTLTNEERKRGWKVHSNCAHANFQCASCHKTWHSAKVTLLFHYRLRGNRGTVIMRPFGQACRSCKTREFARPGFSKKDVEEALLKLMCKIQKNCYGIDDGSSGAYSPRSLKFTDPHEAALCEACIKGICCRAERESETD